MRNNRTVMYETTKNNYASKILLINNSHTSRKYDTSKQHNFRDDNATSALRFRLSNYKQGKGNVLYRQHSFT